MKLPKDTWFYMGDQDWIGLMIFKKFADQDWTQTENIHSPFFAAGRSTRDEHGFGFKSCGFSALW